MQVQGSIGHSNSDPHTSSHPSLRMQDPVHTQDPGLYQPQYRAPQPPMKHFYGGRKYVEGKGRSYVIYGIIQIIFGFICFVFALITISISISGAVYGAGTVSGIAFTVAGIFGCMVGSSMSDCYTMTYLILNIVATIAAMLEIGMSGWEIHRIGSLEAAASADDFIVIKSVFIIISCVIMIVICFRMAYKLRDSPCCRLKRRNNGDGPKSPLDCAMSPSNTTTNSSWHWNVQHDVNQPTNMPQDPNLTKEYLAHMEANPQESLPRTSFPETQPAYC